MRVEEVRSVVSVRRATGISVSSIIDGRRPPTRWKEIDMFATVVIGMVTAAVLAWPIGDGFGRSVVVRGPMDAGVTR